MFCLAKKNLIFKLTADLLWAAGSFFQHIQYILPLPFTERCRESVAVWLDSHHRAILHTFVQTAAASRAIPHLARGPGVTLIICAHWKHRSQVNTPMIQLYVGLKAILSTVQNLFTLSDSAVFITKACNYSVTHHSDPQLHSKGSQLGAGWFHCGTHTPLWWRSRWSPRSTLCSDRCGWCRCSHMADTPYQGDIAMLQDDRHLAMHEQMRNTSASAYVCVSFLCLCLLTAEVVSSPADADLMCVADRHVRR